MWARVDLARQTAWQCDELPLLMRFTSLGLWASNEVEAQTKFLPGGYSLREGTIRSVSVPRSISAYHTTTGFWANLTLSTLGYSPLVGRLMPLFWSLVAIFAAATAAALISRNLLAGSFAAIIVALSPLGTAQAAQIRGYAEAMAAATLLLLVLEWWRRDPKSAIRICAVFLVALQASLTVYTVWIYWVFPIFAYGVAAIPRTIDRTENHHAARASLAVTFVALVAIMGIFTVQRLHSLTFSSTFGERFVSLGDALAFAVHAAALLLPFAPIVLLAGGIGAVLLHRSERAWWLRAGIISMGMLLLFAIMNGSAGYARNLSYVVGPVAALGGVGLAAVCHAALTRAPKRTAPAAAAILLVIMGSVSVASASTLRDRAYAQLLPDWGAVANKVGVSTDAERPHHLALCKANHWQIRWQLGPAANPPITQPPSPFDLVVGAQRSESGERVIFRALPGVPGIRPAPLPEWFRNAPAATEIAGVELRAFTATPIESSAIPPHQPLFIATRREASTNPNQWTRFIESPSVTGAGLIPMKEVYDNGSYVQTMIVGRNGEDVIQALSESLGARRDQITAYALESIPTQPAQQQQTR